MTARRAFLLLLGLLLSLLLTVQGHVDPQALSGVVQPAEAAPLQQDFPTVSFPSSRINVTEPDSGEREDLTLTVNISRAPDQGEEAKVTYKSANGSATAGEDYEEASGTLTFPVGSADSQTFTVSIIGNNSFQPDRSFVVFLTNPENATVAIPGSVTVTIIDNDPPPATSTPSPTPGGEVFLDQYEPNNVPQEAYTTADSAEKLTGISLWPAGDQDYFQFFGKENSTYEVFTTYVTAGLDTFLRV